MSARAPRALALLSVAALATSVVSTAPAATTTAEPDAASTSSPSQTGTARETPGFVDTRVATTTAGTAAAVAETTADRGSADVAALRREIGPDASISVDPATGTPRQLTSLGGYLTGPSSRRPAAVVLSYVRAHATDLGLVPADLSTFSLRTASTDPSGITHLSWVQQVRGVPVFGNGLKAHVDRDGRIIAIQGSPVSGLTAQAADLSTTPDLSATDARTTAATDVGGEAAAASVRSTGRAGATQNTTWSNGDEADLQWFLGPDGLTLGWTTYVQAGDGLMYTHVLDAGTGDVLYRRDLTDSADGDALVYENYPGAATGGKPTTVNFVKKGWLSKGATWLSGKYARAWTDVDDDNVLDQSEKTRVPGTRNGAQFRLQKFTKPGPCKTLICSWDSDEAGSWRKNRQADAANVFYLVSNYHDYLAKKPFGFTAKAGAFDANGGDPVLVNALDGASTGGGLPDADHIDNANMGTPPDGTSPTMQMYLWHQPGTTYAEDPFIDTSGAFDASIVLHEYTHGLSNRLVTDASGNSTLNSLQAGSMGEAWSDYYAMDYLVTKGLETDKPGVDGQVLEGKYVIGGGLFRTQGIDCPVDATAKNCTGIDGTKGGYTYGDLATIGGAPEVHSSGELWSQTLWDLRTELGHGPADTLITRAMQLSPADPSMLDMRNAILQADKVVDDGAHSGAIWRIFAARGMGWYAGSIDGGDVEVAEDFHVRPAPTNPPGAITGRVLDSDSNEPVAGAQVVVTGQASGYVGSYTARTGADGRFTIANVRPGKYQKVAVLGVGYDVVSGPVRVLPNQATVKSYRVRRDWAASAGGGQVTDFDGVDYTSFGCGPAGAIDLSSGTGWGSTTGATEAPSGVAVPKSITVELPRPIDISADTNQTAFGVDPTATCGDPGSSSTAEYTIEVSTDGTTFQTVADGTGDAAFTTADQRTTVPVASSTAVDDVTTVRFTMVSPQVPDFATNCPAGAYGGCTYMDLTELKVYGTP